MPHTTDLDLIAKDVAELASPDAITALLAKLGYDTADRTALSPEAVGLAGESAGAIKKIELLSEVPEQQILASTELRGRQKLAINCRRIREDERFSIQVRLLPVPRDFRLSQEKS